MTRFQFRTSWMHLTVTTTDCFECEGRCKWSARKRAGARTNRSGCCFWRRQDTASQDCRASPTHCHQKKSWSVEVAKRRKFVHQGDVSSGQSPRHCSHLERAPRPRAYDPPDCPRLFSRFWPQHLFELDQEKHASNLHSALRFSTRAGRRHKRTLQGVARLTRKPLC